MVHTASFTSLHSLFLFAPRPRPFPPSRDADARPFDPWSPLHFLPLDLFQSRAEAAESFAIAAIIQLERSHSGRSRPHHSGDSLCLHRSSHCKHSFMGHTHIIVHPSQLSRSLGSVYKVHPFGILRFSAVERLPKHVQSAAELSTLNAESVRNGKAIELKSWFLSSAMYMDIAHDFVHDRKEAWRARLEARRVRCGAAGQDRGA